MEYKLGKIKMKLGDKKHDITKLYAEAAFNEYISDKLFKDLQRLGFNNISFKKVMKGNVFYTIYANSPYYTLENIKPRMDFIIYSIEIRRKGNINIKRTSYGKFKNVFEDATRRRIDNVRITMFPEINNK